MPRNLLSAIFLFMALLALPFTASHDLSAANAPERDVRERNENSLPSHDLLIRFEIRGGLLLPEATSVPMWSLYGDGLVIWTKDGKPTPGFTNQVWTGHLAKNEILQLMSFVEKVGFWKLDANYQPSHQISPDGKTVLLHPDAALDQPSSILTVHSSAGRKQVTIYPANWPGAPKAYSILRDRLLETRPEGVQEFQPQSFRLEIRTLFSRRRRAQETAWPFQDLDLTRAQSGVLILSREEGLAVAEFLTDHSPIVLQDSQAFSLRLFADPP